MSRKYLNHSKIVVKVVKLKLNFELKFLAKKTTQASDFSIHYTRETFRVLRVLGTRYKSEPLQSNVVRTISITSQPPHIINQIITMFTLVVKWLNYKF